MKKIYQIICISILFLGCSNNNLNKDQVKEFVVSHFNEQVGGKEAIANFIGNISDSIILYNLSNGWSGRPEWVNDHSRVKAEWFYEDSVVAEVKSIETYDNIASVYGNISYYTAGIKTSRSGFHSVIGEEKGRLVFKRHAWMNWDINRSSNSFVWPSTEVDGALSMYNKMRYAMANFRNNDAVAYSDSLVYLDPDLAVAHIGKLHYLYINGEREKLVSLLNDLQPKLVSASIAEKYYIKTFSPSKTREEILVKYRNALLYAANDPLLRAFYSYYLEDLDERIENAKIGLKRFPENSCLNNMMAYLMLEKEDFESAKNHLKVYMTVHPDEPNAYDSMGDILLASGDSIEAKKMFLKAYKMSRELKTGPEEFFNTSKIKADKIE